MFLYGFDIPVAMPLCNLAFKERQHLTESFSAEMKTTMVIRCPFHLIGVIIYGNTNNYVQIV